jgi:peptidoglycan/LPS O-acetylase OafA/YrhL
VFTLFVLPNVDRLAGPGQVSQLRETQFWYWTYMVNIGSAVKQLNAAVPIVHSQFWSLAVEEQFYLLWPFLLLLFSRRAMMILCGALVFGALALRFILVDPISASFANLNASHVLLPARVDTLALGALLAFALRGGVDLTRFRPHAYLVAAGSFVVLAVLFVRHHGLSALDRDVQTIGFSALALFYAALLLIVLTVRPAATLHGIFTHSALRFLGRYSYAIYVFHLLVAFELAREVGYRDWARTVFGSQIPFNIVFSLSCTAVAVTAAWLSWHLFEKRILTLKRYVPYGGEVSLSSPVRLKRPATDP